MTLSRLAPFLIAIGAFITDRITKRIIRGGVSVWDNIVVIPGFFSIVHAENRGAAFGFLSDSTSPLRTTFLVGISGAVMLLICYVLWNPGRAGLGEGRLSRYGLACILGGAAGNLFDRLTSGTVTDFLELYFGSYQFPAFNAADTAITIGAGLLLIEMWIARHHKPDPNPAVASQNSDGGR